ncbi:MAG: ribose-5-phosphate isomerase RpiA [Bacteroidota bacterium]|nr:ribose-5-phosphate isomerase RpiA [Bacteroidota bacterium]MDE2955456.1 ribose-5-phosphate isomerase RpiA [Bacteroidota bacterium]
MDQTVAKRRAGEAAARWVTSGMHIGLGTGSTTAFAIQALGARVRAEGLAIAGVPTSSAAAVLARAEGIPLCDLNDLRGGLDLALDGADEVDPQFNLIKGRGAAHTREKIVAQQARRFVVLIDPTKQVDQLGTRMPVPVEVLPMAAAAVMRAIEQLGGRPAIRMGVRKDGPVVTDQGLWVIDARFEGLHDPASLNHELLMLPGVLDHGLFIGMATDVVVGGPEGVEVLQHR